MNRYAFFALCAAFLLPVAPALAAPEPAAPTDGVCLDLRMV